MGFCPRNLSFISSLIHRFTYSRFHSLLRPFSAEVAKPEEAAEGEGEEGELNETAEETAEHKDKEGEEEEGEGEVASQEEGDKVAKDDKEEDEDRKK